MLKIGFYVEHGTHFCGAQHLGKARALALVRKMLDELWAPQCRVIEKLQGRNGLIKKRVGDFPLLNQMQLVSANVRRAQLIRGLTKEAGKVRHTAQVGR